MADTIRPRVDSHGGDHERIYVLQAIKHQDSERPFNLVNDIEHLEKVIATIGNVQLVVIDPLSAYLGDKDTYKDSEIRSVLTPLAALAEQYGVAVIGISHMGKSEQRKALYRALASIAFVAAARSVFAVGNDKEDPERRIFVGVKNNLARMPAALAFRISVGGVLQWEEQPVDGVDADSILSGPGIPEERGERQDADEFLREILNAGELPAKKVLKAAHENGIAERTLKRAKSRLGVKTRHEGQPGEGGHWFWSLPDGSAKGAISSPKGATVENVASFEQVRDAMLVNSTSSPKDATAAKMAPFGSPFRSHVRIL